MTYEFSSQEKFWLREKSNEELAAISRRRAAGEPLQYILGEWEFCGLKIKCDPRALIPRMETEFLVEAAVAWLRERGTPAKILDVCTGGGCIALALAVKSPVQAEITAPDISSDALALARENAEMLGQDVHFILSDLLADVSGPFDLITANPPYISTAQMEELDASVKNFEPQTALHGGADGMDIYRRLLPQAYEKLSAGGMFITEIGPPKAAELFRAAGFENVEIINDLAGLPRIVKGEKPNV